MSLDMFSVPVKLPGRVLICTVITNWFGESKPASEFITQLNSNMCVI